MSETLQDRPTSKYGHNERAEVAAFVPAAAQRLLDVGCNTGGFGAGLKRSRQIEVWGLEPNQEAAAAAERFLDKVVCESFDSRSTVPDGYFDVVAFNDVLEHLEDPWSALAVALNKLRPGGCVIASIPNFLHKENLLHLLKDRDFRYETEGIRDRTHLRFFTRKSTQRMFAESGYAVDRIVGVNERWWSPDLRSRLAYRIFGRQLEETKCIQWVVVASPQPGVPPARPSVAASIR